MGWMARVIAIAALVALTLPGKAEDNVPDGKQWMLTAGAFVPTDNDLCGADTETGFTLAAFHKVRDGEKDAVLVFLRYTRYDLNNDQWVELWSPMVEYRLKPSTNAYLALALGTVLGANNNGGHTWSAAYEVGAGWNVSSSFALEARWIRGTKRGEHGVAVSAGFRF